VTRSLKKILKNKEA